MSKGKVLTREEERMKSRDRKDKEGLTRSVDVDFLLTSAALFRVGAAASVVAAVFTAGELLVVSLLLRRTLKSVALFSVRCCCGGR